MFLVPTIIAPSPIHGMGVFTTVPIRAGEIVWRFDPAVDYVARADEVETLPECFRQWFLACAYLDGAGRYVLCGDNARLTNHSTSANCRETPSGDSRADRDIEAGEELTSDYREFDMHYHDRLHPWLNAE